MPARIDEKLPKRCTKCGVVKQPSEFGKGPRRRDGTFGLSPACRQCRVKITDDYFKRRPEVRKRAKKRWSAKQTEARRSNPIEKMRAKLWKSMGVARKNGGKPCNATVDELLADFNGACHVCGITEKEAKKGLNMDHCHKTGKFRGWLCGNCNKAAGLLGESPERMRNLARYIEHAEVGGDG